MKTPLDQKSSVNDIRTRFDDDVERFSNLETGQLSTIDAPLTIELITRAAVACNPEAKVILDIGCGAGNYTLRLLQLITPLDCDLVDLSRPVLERAKSCSTGKIYASPTFPQNILISFLPVQCFTV